MQYMNRKHLHRILQIINSSGAVSKHICQLSPHGGPRWSATGDGETNHQMSQNHVESRSNYSMRPEYL
jgi:hypothetical protein